MLSGSRQCAKTTVSKQLVSKDSIIASFSSKFIDKSDITTKLGISKVTLNTYINILEQTYLTDILLLHNFAKPYKK